MGQAVGKHTDAYLKNLAMTVVQLKAMSEITSLQSDLLKEKAEIARQTESIAESKVQIAQARRQLTLEIKKNAEIRELLLQERKISADMRNPDQAEVLSIQDVVKNASETMKKVVVKKTPLNTGRRRG